ncbi:hypothetical protein FVE85_4502 [Porphyridium purpureum]|uniref:Uncharacterized protein n=1 Tax=Porphyridium purpureum TaxID=35688 RepID=A0A5J4YIW2_PORPP|nr:hypothetical protein FVE85_4502 [Porphyridium purpureum]|eukprot:POR2142..scf297_16
MIATTVRPHLASVKLGSSVQSGRGARSCVASRVQMPCAGRRHRALNELLVWLAFLNLTLSVAFGANLGSQSVGEISSQSEHAYGTNAQEGLYELNVEPDHAGTFARKLATQCQGAALRGSTEQPDSESADGLENGTAALLQSDYVLLDAMRRWQGEGEYSFGVGAALRLDRFARVPLPHMQVQIPHETRQEQPSCMRVCTLRISKREVQLWRQRILDRHMTRFGLLDLVLPAVPLGFEMRGVFYVYNHMHLTVKYTQRIDAEGQLVQRMTDVEARMSSKHLDGGQENRLKYCETGGKSSHLFHALALNETSNNEIPILFSVMYTMDRSAPQRVTRKVSSRPAQALLEMSEKIMRQCIALMGLVLALGVTVSVGLLGGFSAPRRSVEVGPVSGTTSSAWLSAFSWQYILLRLSLPVSVFLVVISCVQCVLFVFGYEHCIRSVPIWFSTWIFAFASASALTNCQTEIVRKPALSSVQLIWQSALVTAASLGVFGCVFPVFTRFGALLACLGDVFATTLCVLLPRRMKFSAVDASGAHSDENVPPVSLLPCSTADLDKDPENSVSLDTPGANQMTRGAAVLFISLLSSGGSAAMWQVPRAASSSAIRAFVLDEWLVLAALCFMASAVLLFCLGLFIGLAFPEDLASDGNSARGLDKSLHVSACCSFVTCVVYALLSLALDHTGTSVTWYLTHELTWCCGVGLALIAPMFLGIRCGVTILIGPRRRSSVVR